MHPDGPGSIACCHSMECRATSPLILTPGWPEPPQGASRNRDGCPSRRGPAPPISSSRKTRSGRAAASRERRYLSSSLSGPQARAASGRTRPKTRAAPAASVPASSRSWLHSDVRGVCDRARPATGVDGMVAYDLAPSHRGWSNTHERPFVSSPFGLHY
jgi:hypothetical protein